VRASELLHGLYLRISTRALANLPDFASLFDILHSQLWRVRSNRDLQPTRERVGRLCAMLWWADAKKILSMHTEQSARSRSKNDRAVGELKKIQYFFSVLQTAEIYFGVWRWDISRVLWMKKNNKMAFETTKM
jgi:hypothetical protein